LCYQHTTPKGTNAKICTSKTRRKKMNSFGKFLMTVFIILYVVSPIDACPGPIDDIIVILLVMALKKGDGGGKRINE
jgi:uncharacterized membrane protein YkvA (DUF1232 family)